MKFLDLRLVAYGPFRDVKLAFEPDALGLHVIYGPNEAGKSTALRAVKGLLYGIRVDTPDAHTHRTADLRIGARLGDEHGATLDVVRRKGNKNTLLDPSEHPIDEALLKRLLGGVGEEHFATMFGLDHDGLRRGAQALLAGHGHVGESLFEAGLGGVGLHDVLGELRTEAEALFTANARNRPLNVALKDFADAQKRSRSESMPADAWLTQKQAIADATEEKERLEREARALGARRAQLGRTRRARPLIGKRRAVRAERAELGEVVLLDEDAAAGRKEALRDRDQARGRIDQLGRDAAGLDERRGQLQIPESLVGEQARMKSVQDRYGGYENAGRDLPRVRGELRRADDELAALELGLGRAGETGRRVDAALQARVKKLALEAQGVAAALARAARTDDEARAALEATRAQVAALPAAPDAAPLRAVIDEARRHGDLEAALARIEEERARLAAGAERKLALLGQWSGPLARLPSLRLPAPETVTVHEQAFAALDRELERLAADQSRLHRRREQIAVELEVLRREGAPPTEQDLDAARSARGEAWSEIRRGGAGAAQLEAYEARVGAADAIADRLRREALSVAKLAQLLAAQGADEREAARLDGERTRLEAGRETAAEAWRAVWRPAEIVPLSPSEMRGWLQRHAQLAAQVEQLESLARDAAAQTLLRDHQAAELARALRATGADDVPDETLARRIDRAVAVALELDAAALRRHELEAAVERQAQEVESHARERAERDQAFTAWRAAWVQVTGALGLGEDASPEEATAVLDLHAELERALDRRRELVRRVEGMDRDMSQYAADVGALAAAHVPALAGLPVDQAASQLMSLYQKGRSDLQRREEIDAQREEKRQSLAAERERLEQAGLRLGELMRAAHAGDLAALELAEQRSQKAHALDTRLREVEEQLHGLCDGASLAELETEAQAHAADDLDAELERVEDELGQVERDKEAIIHRIGMYEQGLADWDRGSSAAEAAAEAQEHLARARGHVDRWLRVKLSQAVLARQIEHYRERNQGPILTRASELFRRLTLEKYGGLRSAFDDRDQPVLACLRGDGREVPVEGLSDGTRDQLYLSLRLATLERHAHAHEPMPLVVDDILIHFDDSRAQASLAVLGELSRTMQVLFFTHHARLLELARQAVPAQQLKEHRLP